MVADYLDQIRAIQPAGPYHLLAWSFGGIVAYSLASHLQLQGEQVALLALLDTYPPDPNVPCDAVEDSPAPPTDAWRPYARGQITSRQIASRHPDMTQPGPIAQIGQALAVEPEKRAQQPINPIKANAN